MNDNQDATISHPDGKESWGRKPSIQIKSKLWTLVNIPQNIILPHNDYSSGHECQCKNMIKPHKWSASACRKHSVQVAWSMHQQSDPQCILGGYWLVLSACAPENYDNIHECILFMGKALGDRQVIEHQSCLGILCSKQWVVYRALGIVCLNSSSSFIMDMISLRAIDMPTYSASVAERATWGCSLEAHVMGHFS